MPSPEDFKRGLTESQLEEIRRIFKSMPSYTEDGFIPSLHITELFKRVGYTDRTPEQLAAYKNYCDKLMGGKIILSETLSLFGSTHDAGKIMIEQVAKFDKDGDGFISADEFEILLTSVKTHDPIKMDGITFESFVKEADANKDGKVSLKECQDWLRRHLNHA